MPKVQVPGKWVLTAVVAVISLALIILLSKLVIYLLICVVTGFLVYVRYTLQLPFKIEPYLFFSVIVTLGYGIGFTVFYVFIAMLIPKVIAGGEVDGSTLLYLVFFVILNMIARSFSGMSVSTVGIIISLADFTILLILGAVMKPEKIKTGMLIVGVNIFLFIHFGEPLLGFITAS
ncbi:hypothetical protein A3K63_05515 [Candidatus Micrarchaeota archaeon RBG_16_49_10]|nr:MAG: hypothetical protein A3K63_05515 [Candidatus Micrarchaeota archaeon RBG_16_49_10]